MTHPKIVEHNPVSMAEMKDLLKDIRKRDGELSFRGQKTEEYLEQIGVLRPKEAVELFEKIKKLDIPRFKDEHICKIIDVMPLNTNELKMVMQGYALTVANDNLAKIQKLVDEFMSKKLKPDLKAEPVSVAETPEEHPSGSAPVAEVHTE
jgi:DNA-directed RNA polymerase subunit F